MEILLAFHFSISASCCIAGVLIHSYMSVTDFRLRFDLSGLGIPSGFVGTVHREFEPRKLGSEPMVGDVLTGVVFGGLGLGYSQFCEVYFLIFYFAGLELGCGWRGRY